MAYSLSYFILNILDMNKSQWIELICFGFPFLALALVTGLIAFGYHKSKSN